MAHPFTVMPTLGKFLSQLQKREDCTVERTSSYVQITCSLADGEQPIRIKKETPESSVLSPHAIILFCNRLRIPIKDFIPPLSEEDDIPFGTY